MVFNIISFIYISIFSVPSSELRMVIVFPLSIVFMVSSMFVRSEDNCIILDLIFLV